jgi:subtilisin family serine protease
MALTRSAGKRRAALIGVAMAGAVALVGPNLSWAQSVQTDNGTGLYIVQLAGTPLAGYQGDVKGFAATKPAAGKTLDTRTPAAQAYRGRLRDQRAAILKNAHLDGHPVTDVYDVPMNGFAMKITASEAARLKSTPGVLNVWKDAIVTTDTVSTPKFLGLDGRKGVWNTQFGSVDHAGEGIIVGVLDTGFWPESPSFAPLSEPRPDAAAIAAKFHGVCDQGTDPVIANRVTCNNKVIGARFFDAGGLSNGPGANEFHSPRDRNSHGSHTASTAAGDHGAPVTINGLSLGTASGMAPNARLSVYKIGWNKADGTASATTTDIVAAINAAVSDGVDVINLSFSGATSEVNDAVEVNFMFAADAGVFVAASAGNSGPGASTVAHNSPWLTTVAASTHDRSFVRTATTGDGTVYSGPGVGPGVPSSPLVYAANVGLPGVDPTLVRQCLSDVDGVTPGIQPALDPTKVSGTIVLCDRGLNARTDKSLAVKNAGGVGMILGNVSPNSLNADVHFVPTIHVSDTDRAAILAYIASAGAGATASLSAATQVTAEAPAMAAFSSNGPAIAGGGDLLKPDITAPGVDVIAAVSPAADNGNFYDAESGTSMSSPHIAGIAALVIQKHPDWSPMAVKSALMTSASQIDNLGQPILGPDGVHPATPLNFGSGHVKPVGAFSPGLVYDSGLANWVQFGCGLGEFQPVFGQAVCDSFGSIDPSNLNYPTLAIGDLAGSQTLTRTVTNVDKASGTYAARVVAPAGFTVKATPNRFVVRPGTSFTYSGTITRTTAPFGQYGFGSLTWKQVNGSHKVRSNIAVRPVPLAAPVEVAGSGATGDTAVSLTPGYSGTLTATPLGLAPDAPTVANLTGINTTFNPAAPATGPAVSKVTVAVPAGSRYARFGTHGSDYPDGTDVDVFVYQAGTNTLVGQSAGGTAQETVNLTAAGSYDVYAVLFAQPGGGTGPFDVTTQSYVVPSVGSSLNANPLSQPVTLGSTATVTAEWGGLAPGTSYLGVIDFRGADGSNVIGSTVVSVTT